MSSHHLLPSFLRLLLLGLLFLLGSSNLATHAQSQNHAGLVIQFESGTVVTDCIAFSEPSITGAELLQRSFFSVIIDPASGFGEAICSIGDANQSNGCNYPLEDCFCECQGFGECNYWAYYHLENDAWVYSQVGASSWTVTDGAVDGWAWGPGSMNASSEVQPPVLSFDEICQEAFPPALPTPTPSPQPTKTPTPSPTPLPTDTPTSTPLPTFTPTPTHTPTPTSEPVEFTPTPTPLPLLAIDFALDPETIVAGECATLSWSVSGAEALFLRENDGQEQAVSFASALRVCPLQDTTYTLRVQRAGSEQILRQSLSVRPTTPSPTATSLSAPDQPVPTPTAVATSTPTITPLPPSPTPTPTPIPTNTPTPEATATPSPLPAAATISLSQSQLSPKNTVPLLTPVPPPPTQSSGRLNPATFLRLGAFAIILALLIAAGLWAVMRQSTSHDR
ncbi:MAG: hypothetical protein GXP38_01805 [Chloroflexi bacterium]|nr:hypothetical protein [Chloroflexota bacterium]